MATDYVPRSELQLAIWFTNFGKKITTHGKTFGLTDEEIKLAESRSNETSAKIAEIEQKKTELQHIVALKDDLKSEVLASIRGFVTRMKAHTAYTEAMGHDLGIIAAATTTSTKGNKTVIKADVLPGRVRLSFVKRNFSGVNIYTRPIGTAQWEYLARDNNSPYDDERPLANGQPEKREYMAIGVVGDEEVGDPSDIISVVFGG